MDGDEEDALAAALAESARDAGSPAGARWGRRSPPSAGAVRRTRDLQPSMPPIREAPLAPSAPPPLAMVNALAVEPRRDATPGQEMAEVCQRALDPRQSLHAPLPARPARAAPGLADPSGGSYVGPSDAPSPPAQPSSAGEGLYPQVPGAAESARDSPPGQAVSGLPDEPPSMRRAAWSAAGRPAARQSASRPASPSGSDDAPAPSGPDASEAEPDGPAVVEQPTATESGSEADEAPDQDELQGPLEQGWRPPAGFPLTWQSLLVIDPELKQLFRCAHLAQLDRVPLPYDTYQTREIRAHEPSRGYLLPEFGGVDSAGCECVHRFPPGSSLNPVQDVKAVRFPGEVETFGIVVKVRVSQCSENVTMRDCDVWATLTKGAVAFARLQLTVPAVDPLGSEMIDHYNVTADFDPRPSDIPAAEHGLETVPESLRCGTMGAAEPRDYAELLPPERALSAAASSVYSLVLRSQALRRFPEAQVEETSPAECLPPPGRSSRRESLERSWRKRPPRSCRWRSPSEAGTSSCRPLKPSPA